MSTLPSSTFNSSFMQGQVLAFIYNYSCIAGQPPTDLEVQAYFTIYSGYSGRSILNILDSLERSGAIRRNPHKPRSLEVLVSAEELPTLQPGHAIKIIVAIGA